MTNATTHRAETAQFAANRAEQLPSYPPSDLYIMIPCVLNTGKRSNKLHTATAANSSSTSETYIRTLEAVAKYEMYDEIARQLTRRRLCQVELVCMTDHIEAQHKIELGTMNIDLILTKHEQANLACVTLLFPSISIPITPLLDQMSQNELTIIHQQQKIALFDYLDKQFGLRRMGTSRSFTNLSKPVGEQKLMYLLANEANDSQMITHKLRGDQLREAANTNIAQYDFSQIYIYLTSIVQIYTVYEEQYLDRLKDHVLTLFIMELILMQDAAISRVSHRVSLELNHQSDISLKVIKDLNFEFAKTRFLWNLNHFTYSATQTIAASFIKGFRIQEQLEAFNENKQFLEALINAQIDWDADRKTKLLNFFVFVLTLSSVLPIYYAFTKFLVFDQTTGFDQWFALVTVVVVLLCYFGFKFIFWRKR